MPRLVEAIQAFPGALSGPGLVAVSGGADSVALVCGLREAGLGPLTVAHFNHHLRGPDSDADEDFVCEMAKRLGLDLQIGSAEVAAAGGNLEATARRLRYDWFAEAAREVAATWVATGHTANDQAETVLHRLMRGTGLQGLRGISARRPLTPEIQLVRPILTATRADVLDYLRERQQPHCDDASNQDPRFTRNRIRHKLIPLLKTFNPGIVEVLGRLAEQAGDLFIEVRDEAATLLQATERPRAGKVLVFDAATLAEAPTDRVRELFRLVWDREDWPKDGMTFAHWDRLARVPHGDPYAAEFPAGISARRVGRVVRLARRG